MRGHIRKKANFEDFTALGQPRRRRRLKLPSRRTVACRPGFIQPLHGIRSRTWLYKAGLAVGHPLFPSLRLLFPKQMLTTEQVGQAMLVAAREPGAGVVLDPAGIQDCAARFSPSPS